MIKRRVGDRAEAGLRTAATKRSADLRDDRLDILGQRDLHATDEQRHAVVRHAVREVYDMAGPHMRPKLNCC